MKVSNFLCLFIILFITLLLVVNCQQQDLSKVVEASDVEQQLPVEENQDAEAILVSENQEEANNEDTENSESRILGKKDKKLNQPPLFFPSFPSFPSFPQPLPEFSRRRPIDIEIVRRPPIYRYPIFSPIFLPPFIPEFVPTSPPSPSPTPTEIPPPDRKSFDSGGYSMRCLNWSIKILSLWLPYFLQPRD